MKTSVLSISFYFISICTLFSQSRKDSLYVFVGEKIDVHYFIEDTTKRYFDASFKAKYKIIKNVFGDYKADTIEFMAFDHYGVPPFSQFKNVLLFVSVYKGKLYHEKYQFFEVYKTTDGRWASCGDPYKYDDYHRKDLKPVKITFEDLDCKRGTYVEDLFKVKKEGVLKARGIFD